MSFEDQGLLITALNFHVWQPCNMSCRYCFAEFRDAIPQLQKDKALLRERALAVVRAASDAGISKLTFVGGEPTLCPWFTELLVLARKLGMVTMVVSNGSKMDATWIANHADWLDWAAISIDSLNANTNRSIGRAVGRSFVPDEPYYRNLFSKLAEYGIRTKVNTVVSSLNWDQDFSNFLRAVLPERWKVFQALHIRGENDNAFPELSTSAEQFDIFVKRHEGLSSDLLLAAEDNYAMIGSYLMIDPVGRFFANKGGVYQYSQPIWDVGWKTARSQVDVSSRKFIERGGLYDWI
jgi:radical S-adenosyl methionine domain-containing protein 2